MIDPARLAEQLEFLDTRASARVTAGEWGTGKLSVIPSNLLPKVEPEVRSTLNRLAKQAKSIGPRVVESKLYGTLGEISWSDTTPEISRMLEAADLDALAAEILENSYYSGMITAIVRRDPEDAMLRAEPLLGHVEPIYDRDSPTFAKGLIHAWVDPYAERNERTWVVRIYDLVTRELAEYRGLDSPGDLAKRAMRGGGIEPRAIVRPTAEYPLGAPLPRFQVVGRDADRNPYGLLSKLLPLIQSDWSSQVRGDRIEEATAIPQLLVKGEVGDDGVEERAPDGIIRVYEDGDARYLIPGDMTTLHNHQERKLHRIREDGALPGSFSSGLRNPPSGEALREANARYVASNTWMAGRLSRVLSEIAGDLVEATGTPRTAAPVVTVSTNRDFTRSMDIDDTIKLWREDLVDQGAAVRATAPHIPNWEQADVDAFIESRRPRSDGDRPPAPPLEVDSAAV